MPPQMTVFFSSQKLSNSRASSGKGHSKSTSRSSSSSSSSSKHSTKPPPTSRHPVSTDSHTECLLRKSISISSLLPPFLHTTLTLSLPRTKKARLLPQRPQSSNSLTGINGLPMPGLSGTANGPVGKFPSPRTSPLLRKANSTPKYRQSPQRRRLRRRQVKGCSTHGWHQTRSRG